MREIAGPNHRSPLFYWVQFPSTKSRSPRSRSPRAVATWIVALAILPSLLGAAALPWKDAGLTEREAAAHLLDRLAFGARPGEVDRVLELGLERWLDQQLGAVLLDPVVDHRLAGLDTLAMDAETIVRTFPDPGRVLRATMREGESMSQSMSGAKMDDGPERPDDSPDADRDRRQRIQSYLAEHGLRPQQELVGQLLAQKMLRAVYSENQLREVLTDFWFNHFNVSIRHNQARSHVLSYERDAIRPHVLGRFTDLLTATARHPAMLLFLDNASSRAAEGQKTTFAERSMSGRQRAGPRYPRPGAADRRPGAADRRPGAASLPPNPNLPNRPTGLNENYARELLELHTLGVDGGYDQQDVIEVARALTGWVYLPPADSMRGGGPRFPPPEMARRAGFQRDGLFVFHPGFHDAEKKTVLGHTLPAGRGIEDGNEVLAMLALHSATARHLGHKLAVRFVDDKPPAELVERLAARYLATQGDLGAVVRALVESPEFWASRRQKIRSPFELVVASLRATGAMVGNPRAAVEWVERIGQPLYAYQAPTGYPDQGDFWVNTGALLNRMNFGMQLAAGRLPGITINLLALAGGHEPESIAHAASTYAALLMPGRDIAETVSKLEPALADGDVLGRIAEAAEASPVVSAAAAPEMDDPEAGPRPGFGGGRRRGRAARVEAGPPPSPLAQVVGLIVGSPEYQRR